MPVIFLVVPGSRRRGWANCCGHDALSLSVDDPGMKSICGSRALVTADKGERLANPGPGGLLAS